jgi:hypothetical protein
MDSDFTRNDLDRYLLPSAREAFRTAIDEAYRDTGSRFDPVAGCDAQWFGWTVWKFGEHQLKETLRDDRLGLRDASAGGQFRIGFGPFVMASYACGHAMPEDPWKEFPNNDRGAGFLSDINTGQWSLSIDGFDEHPGVAIVLAHYGNHENGLEGLYIKMPCAQAAGRISEWGYIEELWRIDRSTGYAPGRPKGPVLPGPVKIGTPALPFRKPIKKSDTDTA